MSGHCRLEDGIWVVICPICESVRPAPDNRPVDKPIHCNVNCYLLGHRKDPVELPAPIPGCGRSRVPITVYGCAECGSRGLAARPCPRCTMFMRPVGIGGKCMHCDEPIALADLVPEEVVRWLAK